MASSASSSGAAAGGIGATVLAMVSQLRSTPPGPDRDAAIAQLCTASNVPVEFVNMAIAMPEQRLRKVPNAGCRHPQYHTFTDSHKRNSA